MFDGLSMPFTVIEVLEGAFSLMKLLGPFIAIGVALAFVGPLITVIKKAAPGRGSKA